MCEYTRLLLRLHDYCDTDPFRVGIPRRTREAGRNNWNWNLFSTDMLTT
jgi:hypothetical protein